MHLSFTTCYCAGIMSTARHASIELKMADYSSKLYQSYPNDSILVIVVEYMKTGSISVTNDNICLMSCGSVMGIPCEFITPKKVASLHPLVNIHDLVGAMYLPEDALMSSANVSVALTTAASWSGGWEHTRMSPSQVDQLRRRKKDVQLLSTSIIYLPKYRVPTSFLSSAAVVDPDGRIYIHNWQEGWNQLLSPTMQGYFVLAGMNSAGISYGGEAEWMVNGYLSENVWPLDLKHFGTLQSSCTFLHHRVMEPLCDLKVPLWDFQTGSQLHTSPLYNHLDAQGKGWMEKHGFKRVMHFVPPGKDETAFSPASCILVGLCKICHGLNQVHTQLVHSLTPLAPPTPGELGRRIQRM
uniref:Uncharacterized protein n=1 Tax=Melopsittacus undulatus TaxID=13146 RepID=A0A8V5GU31_MELUD